MLPAGTGTSVATPGTESVVVEGITFSVMVNVVGPPGGDEPPAEPVPPALFRTVVTGSKNVSVPVKVRVGGA
jgi:hypothetical protein